MMRSTEQTSNTRRGERARKTGDHPEEKPEPDDEAKKKASEMMTAYEDRPTLVLPGTGGAVSGTAVNDWLDDDGNPTAPMTRMPQRPKRRPQVRRKKTRH